MEGRSGLGQVGGRVYATVLMTTARHNIESSVILDLVVADGCIY